MLTHKQLLNNFTNLLGINSSYGRIAFEIFTHQISQNLDVGDEIEIDSLGFFACRKVRNSTSDRVEIERIIVFSKDRIAAQTQEKFFFFVPGEMKKDFPSIDSFLDLSFNKSHLMSKKETLSEFLWPISISSVESLIESKVERLIADGKVYKSANKMDEELRSDNLKSEIIFDTASNAEVILLNDEKTSDEFVLDDEQREFDNTKPQTEELEIPEKTKLIFDDYGLKRDRSIEDEKSGLADSTSFDEDKILEQDLAQSDEENINLGKIRSEKSYPMNQSSVGKNFLAALVIVFVVASALLVYNNYEVVNKFVLGEQHDAAALVKTKIEPELITRTFEIPVTYPYSKNVELAGPLNDSLIISSSIFKIPEDEQQKDLNGADSKSEVLQVSKVEMAKVRGNVFQRGEEFLIQVSSWKSKVKAESEYAKYRDAGYTAELVEYFSRESGKYYRVMIGGFKSYDEAKEFFKQKK